VEADGFRDLAGLAGTNMCPRKGDGNCFGIFIFIASNTHLQVNIWRMKRCRSVFTCASQIEDDRGLRNPV
jgi:hypothetical protein